jgi:hypothetical protein
MEPLVSWIRILNSGSGPLEAIVAWFYPSTEYKEVDRKWYRTYQLKDLPHPNRSSPPTVPDWAIPAS